MTPRSLFETLGIGFVRTKAGSAIIILDVYAKTENSQPFRVSSVTESCSHFQFFMLIHRKKGLLVESCPVT